MARCDSCGVFRLAHVGRAMFLAHCELFVDQNYIALDYVGRDNRG